MSKSLVIIPTYNEIENIRDILGYVMTMNTAFDVLVVDDNSPDGTAKAVKEQQLQWPERIHLLERLGKHGLGTAYIAGFRFAIQHEYDFIFEMDADFSHNPNDLNKLLAAAENGADMVIGSRYVTGVNVVNWPMGRVLMSYVASMYVRFVTGMPFRDSTAGFKCYKRRVLETIELDRVRFIGYAFQIEMKFLSWKHGFEIAEVPIVFTDRTKGQSKMSRGIFKEAIIGVLEMKIRSFFRKYRPAIY